jgi:hypothetical protein
MNRTEPAMKAHIGTAQRQIRNIWGKCDGLGRREFSDGIRLLRFSQLCEPLCRHQGAEGAGAHQG